jgi:hypothetical protein
MFKYATVCRLGGCLHRNLTDSTLTMTAFWDVAPCSLVDVGRLCRVRFASIIALMVEAVYFNETTRRYIPEICRLHTRCREDLKSDSLWISQKSACHRVNGLGSSITKEQYDVGDPGSYHILY